MYCMYFNKITFNEGSKYIGSVVIGSHHYPIFCTVSVGAPCEEPIRLTRARHVIGPGQGGKIFFWLMSSWSRSLLTTSISEWAGLREVASNRILIGCRIHEINLPLCINDNDFHSTVACDARHLDSIPNPVSHHPFPILVVKASVFFRRFWVVTCQSKVTCWNLLRLKKTYCKVIIVGLLSIVFNALVANNLSHVLHLRN